LGGEGNCLFPDQFLTHCTSFAQSQFPYTKSAESVQYSTITYTLPEVPFLSQSWLSFLKVGKVIFSKLGNLIFLLTTTDVNLLIVPGNGFLPDKKRIFVTTTSFIMGNSY